MFEDIKDEYKRRVNSAYEAAQILKSGDCYDYVPFRTQLGADHGRRHGRIPGGHVAPPGTQVMKPRVVFIHTVYGMKPLFDETLRRFCPEADTCHIADETMIRSILAAGGVTPEIRARLRDTSWPPTASAPPPSR